MSVNPVYISTNNSVLITDPYVIFYQLVPLSVAWDNTAQTSYYMVNSTGSTIPFLDGNFYYDANSVLQTSLAAGVSLYIIKNSINNWIQVTTPNDIEVVTGGSSLTSIPIATSSVLGGIKIGTGFSIMFDGTLSVLPVTTTTVHWGDILDKPSFATVAFTGNYGDLIGAPTLAAVALSGSYTDLTNKPTINFVSLSTTGSSGPATLSGGVLNVPQYTAPAQFITSITTSGTSGPATVSAGVLNVPQYAGGSGVVLTTIGTSGPATLISGTLNVPNYTSGSALPVSMPLASQVGILANGSDQTSALNTILGNALYAGLVIDFSNPAGITISGTVNANGKMLRFNPGSFFTGAGTINNAVIDAGMRQQLFTTSVSLTNCLTAGRYFSAKWYGATGNNSSDDQPALQKSSDTIIANSTMTRDLYVPQGFYRTNRPWMLHNWNGTTYGQFMINIIGDYKMANSNLTAAARILPQFTDGPVIGVQRATSGSIVGLSIEGLLNLTAISSYDTFIDTTWASVSSGFRNSPQSPTAGICIDPVTNGQTPLDGGYPSLNGTEPGGLNWYRGDSSTGGTTDFLIAECRILGFTVDIMNGPTSWIQQGEDCIIRNCRLDNANVAIAYGQTQSDNCKVENCRSWNCIWTVIDTFQYGAGHGQPPNIDGYNVAGTVNTLFNISSNKGFAIKNFYAESFFTIGALQAVFAGGSLQGTFDFGISSSNYEPQWHAQLTNITVHDSSLRYYDDLFNKRLRLFQPRNVTFKNCWFDLPPYVINQDLLQINTVSFENCTVANTGVLGMANDQYFYEAASNYAYPYGNFTLRDKNSIDVSGSGGYPILPQITFEYNNTGYDRKYGGYATGVTITPDTNRTCTFSTFFTYLSLVNDIVTDSVTGNIVGRISNISGSVVTLTEIPKNVAAGTYTLNLIVLTRITNPLIGDITSGSANITNICRIAPGFFNALSPGDRLDSVNFPVGTYIVSVAGTTITMSAAANKTATRQNFLNGDPIVTLKSITPPNYAGNNTYPNAIPTGATWIELVNAVSSSSSRQTVWRFNKGGYLSATTLGFGAAFQSDYAIEPPIRIGPSSFQWYNTYNDTWTSLGGPIYTFALAANTGNYTVVLATANYITLPDLTGQANRNVVLPTATSGAQLILRNINTAGSTFNWIPTGATIMDYTNTAVTLLAPQTTYLLLADGTNWNIIN